MDVEVSVVIPCHDAEDYIRDCIDSVLAQKFENFEILAVDDASSDGTVDCLRSYDDERLRIIELAENSGSPAMPRNTGIRQARGAYIAFLDCDDLWHPDKLLKQIEFMKERQCQFSCTDYIVRGLDGTEHKRKARRKAGLGELLSGNTVGCSTVVISRELVSKFEFRNCPHEDFDMWLQILRANNSVYGLNECLTTYVKRENSRSSLSLRNVFGYHSIFKQYGRVGNFGACMMMLQYLRVKWLGSSRPKQNS